MASDLLCRCVCCSCVRTIFHFISANTPTRACSAGACSESVLLTAHTTVHHALHTRSRQTDREAGRRALKHMQSGDTGSTYLLQGHEHRPQNCPRLFKFFSASFMSLLIWSIPSSMRSSCSDYQHIVIFPSKRTKAHEKRREEEEVAGGGKGGE